jgi:hypothetical protein
MARRPQRPQSDRLVIGIAGRIGAGKTSAAKYLNTKHGFQYLRYSLVLAEWYGIDPENKAELQRVGRAVMASGLQPELNRRLIAQILPGLDAAVDGLRHPTDQESLSEAFSHSFRMLHMECGVEQRWNHVRGKGGYASRDVFVAADLDPVEQHIESLRSKASLVLRNESMLEALYFSIDEAIPSFRKEGLK